MRHAINEGSSLKIAIVSSYPPPKRKHTYASGVASYTKNLAESLKRVSPSLDIFVVADRRPNIPDRYIDQGIKVYRIFDKEISYFFKIFQALRRIKPDVVHIQHEYFLYGGPFFASLFHLLVLLSRMASRKVVVTLHGVIPLNLLKDSKFRRENGIVGPSWLLKVGLWVVTKLTTLLTHIVIVHEPFLKNCLVSDYGVDKERIKMIPHGVENVELIPQDEAMKKLGLQGKKTILFFGYLTGYKGLEILIEAYRWVANWTNRTILIIAGGEHPRLKHKLWYQQWLNQLIRKAERVRQELRGRGEILFTGYMPEENIPIYYSAADLITLPYTVRISASGPEALAIAFSKPVILENPESFNIPHNPKILAKQMLSILDNPNLSRKLAQHNQQLAKERNWNKIAQSFYEIYIKKI